MDDQFEAFPTTDRERGYLYGRTDYNTLMAYRPDDPMAGRPSTDFCIGYAEGWADAHDEAVK